MMRDRRTWPGPGVRAGASPKGPRRGRGFVATFLALALLAPLATAGKEGAGRARPAAQATSPAEYRRAIEAVFKKLRVSPLELDRKVVGPGEVLTAKAELLNLSDEDLVIPPDTGEKYAMLRQRFANLTWHVERVGTRAPRRVELYDSNGIGQRYVIAERIPARKALPLDGDCARVDVDRLGLAPGEYRIWARVAFVEDPSSPPDPGRRRLELLSEARFVVRDPDAGGGAKPEDPGQLERAELLMRKVLLERFRAQMRLASLTLDKAAVRRGETIVAAGEYRNVSGTEIQLPPGMRWGGVEQWWIAKISGSPLIASLEAKANQPSRRGGAYAFGGQSITLKEGKLGPAGYLHVGKTVDTADLDPGDYAIQVVITDPAGEFLGTSEARFKVIDPSLAPRELEQREKRDFAQFNATCRRIWRTLKVGELRIDPVELPGIGRLPANTVSCRQEWPKVRVKATLRSTSRQETRLPEEWKVLGSLSIGLRRVGSSAKDDDINHAASNELIRPTSPIAPGQSLPLSAALPMDPAMLEPGADYEILLRAWDLAGNLVGSEKVRIRVVK